MEALGFTDHIPTTFDLLFRGRTYEAVMSPLNNADGKKGHFRDINPIGATFLADSRAILTIDYNNKNVQLSFA